jgi:mannan endo-1,4-beta-mannosidase
MMVWRVCFHVLVLLVYPATGQAQFVERSGAQLKLDGRPFYFLGANAYYLMESAARGDTAIVKAVFARAQSLNMTVLRTWAFFDWPDSSIPGVLQYLPGRMNESSLRALDYVVAQARRHGIKLLLPLVNGWDDYGGMNQYVRWRMEVPEPVSQPSIRYTVDELQEVIHGSRGKSYRVALSGVFGHDDFYRDTVIRQWFREYISRIINRVNHLTGISYKNEPAIMGWELANEPRSQDRSGALVHAWVDEMSRFIKSIDPNHLVGTGEEGFDVTAVGYRTGSYNEQTWMFDGTTGVSFTLNTALSSIDFASIHLYPESWNLFHSAGNVWIRDHIDIAGRVGKPLILGEFGVHSSTLPTYGSWLNTVMLDGAAGGLVWQLLEGARPDDGFGLRCAVVDDVCGMLQREGSRFMARSAGEGMQAPATMVLEQNYPNPFNSITVIGYTLSVDAHGVLDVFASSGERALTLVDCFQHAGHRRELLDARSLASGAYFYRVAAVVPGKSWLTRTRKLLLVK